MGWWPGTSSVRSPDAPRRALSELDLYLLNAVGDLIYLNKLYPDAHHLRGGATSLEDLLLDCSAFIRLFPDGSDVAFTHTTWRAYYAMQPRVQRVMKTYALAFAPTIVIASSPGLLHSKDDFCTTADLAVMETTNSVFNRTLFDLYTTPQSALSWQRVTVANQIATNGSYWTEVASMYNSGTYNNQWMVLDMERLRSRTWGPHSVPEHTLWIMEQIPGTTVRRVVSSVLAQQGYWASYNIPYLPEIYNASGYPAKAAEFGDDYVYTNCSRARIFARDIEAVATVQDVQRLIRYNDFQHDPLSMKDPVYTIAARADLQPAGTGHTSKAFGAVDAKITTARMAAAHVQTLVQSGPTFDQQQPFSFAVPQWRDIVREGVPDTFAFPWVKFDASGSSVQAA